MPNKKRKVTPATKHKATDYHKKAKAINAPAGTRLAPKGSDMRKKQDAYAKKKISQGNASSLNRESRVTTMGRNMRAAAAESTFKNKDYERYSRKKPK